jgi:hypothetical protein
MELKKKWRTTPTIFLVAMMLSAVLQICVAVVTSEKELRVLCDIHGMQPCELYKHILSGEDQHTS